MKTEASININRNNLGEIHIRIVADKSSLLMFDVRMTPEQFGNVVTGLYQDGIPIECWTQGVHLWDTTREVKRELVPWRGSSVYPTLVEATAAIAEFEVDGWIGNADDMQNMHRAQNGGFIVGFHRFVDADGKPV